MSQTTKPDPTADPVEWRNQFIEQLDKLSPEARKILSDGIYFLAWQRGMKAEDRRPFLQHFTALARAGYWIIRTGAYKA